jgi:hypothetical protein
MGQGPMPSQPSLGFLGVGEQPDGVESKNNWRYTFFWPNPKTCTIWNFVESIFNVCKEQGERVLNGKEYGTSNLGGFRFLEFFSYRCCLFCRIWNCSIFSMFYLACNSIQTFLFGPILWKFCFKLYPKCGEHTQWHNPLERNPVFFLLRNQAACMYYKLLCFLIIVDLDVSWRSIPTSWNALKQMSPTVLHEQQFEFSISSISILILNGVDLWA